jgi:hypothetical protein
MMKAAAAGFAVVTLARARLAVVMVCGGGAGRARLAVVTLARAWFAVAKLAAREVALVAAAAAEVRGGGAPRIGGCEGKVWKPSRSPPPSARRAVVAKNQRKRTRRGNRGARARGSSEREFKERGRETFHALGKQRRDLVGVGRDVRLARRGERVAQLARVDRAAAVRVEAAERLGRGLDDLAALGTVVVEVVAAFATI